MANEHKRNGTLTIKELRTVRQFVAHGLYPEGGLRWLIHLRRQNGLAASGAVLKVGGRIFIHEGKFAQWLAERNAA